MRLRAVERRTRGATGRAKPSDALRADAVGPKKANTRGVTADAIGPETFIATYNARVAAHNAHANGADAKSQRANGIDSIPNAIGAKPICCCTCGADLSLSIGLIVAALRDSERLAFACGVGFERTGTSGTDGTSCVCPKCGYEQTLGGVPFARGRFHNLAGYNF